MFLGVTYLFLSSNVQALGPESKEATVNWNQPRQTITGWGASGGNSSSDAFFRLSPLEQSRLCDLLFDPEIGIGLTMVRNEIYAWDLSPSKGVYDWAKDKSQVWLMKQAKQRGVKQFWSAVWSPPSWMKDNGKYVGGAIKPANYQDFADLLSRYVKEYQSRFGLDISSISVTNEPEVNVDYQSSHWTGETLRVFLKDYLGPTFKRDQVGAQIIVPETCSSDNLAQFIDPVRADRDASRFVGIVATHQYNQSFTGSEPKFPPFEPFKFSEAAVKSGKPLWETEVSFIGGHPDFGMKWGLGLATLVHNAMTGGANAWLWWVFLNDWKDNEGLTDIHGSSFAVAKRLWTFGNFSRFIRPGSKRFEATAYPEPGVLVTAYKDPRGRPVIVVVNTTKGAKKVPIAFEGRTVTDTFVPWVTSATQDLMRQEPVKIHHRKLMANLQAESVTTYVGR